MELAALSLLALFSFAGFICIFFTTFGTLIVFLGALLFALMTDFSILNFHILLILFALYLFGEVVEYVCVILGARKFGASNLAAFGGIVGGIIGAVMGASFFGAGIILGTFLGIFLGAFLVDLIVQRDLVKSLKAGAGGVL